MEGRPFHPGEFPLKLADPAFQRRDLEIGHKTEYSENKSDVFHL